MLHSRRQKDKTTQDVIVALDDLRSRASQLQVELGDHYVAREQPPASASLMGELEDAIESLAMIAELRDPFKAAHERRTAELAAAISDEMELSRDRIKGLRVAALLHDIGEVNIPLPVLTKSSALSASEYEIIKSHPQVGYDLLKEIKFPWPVAEIVLQHHERIDGSGYPEGLSNGDIMLEARLLAVADVIEAMASPRPYRPSHGIEVAIEEIVRYKGIRYDAAVVDSCVKVFLKRGFEFPT